MPKKKIIEPLQSYIDQVISEFDQIEDQRRDLLTKIATKIPIATPIKSIIISP